MRALDDDEYRKIERFLYNYNDLLQRIDEQRAEILYGAAKGSEVSGRASVRADPTAQKAIAMEKLPDQRWLKVIDIVHRRYSQSKKGRLLQLCYFEHRASSEVCEMLDIEPATYYRWKEELVLCTAINAAKQGLLK